MYEREIRAEKIRKPLRVKFDADDEERPFTVVSGGLGDLRLLAYQRGATAQALVPCTVEYPDQYVITGPTQSLILSWTPGDDRTAEIEEQLQKLPLSPAVSAGRYELEIEPRSLLGALYYLSHAVQVPLEHEAAGLVTTTLTETDEPFDWGELTGDLLFVNCCPHRPQNAAVAIEYRDWWFYIDDRDHSSKATFTLLLQLFELQSGGATGVKPVLTLPVGG